MATTKGASTNGAGSDVPHTSTSSNPKDANALPAATLDFAHRMFEAARSGNSEILLAAIDAGLPKNLTNDKGNTLLMLASYAGHLDLTKELISRGADVNALNDLGQSPLAGAVFKGYTEVARALARAGADPRGGRPSAVQAAHMFGRNELFGILGTNDAERDTIGAPIGPEVLMRGEEKERQSEVQA